MKKKISVFSFYVMLLPMFANPLAAQANKYIATADSLFLGVWRGSSICQVKNSPCHDETVVYYISRPRNDSIIEIRANKIVNGQEDEMGRIQFEYDARNREITSISQPNAVWKFKREQLTLEGTLYSNKVLYRIIKLTKQ